MKTDGDAAEMGGLEAPVVLDGKLLNHVSGGLPKLPPGYAAVTLQSGAIIIINKASGRQVFP
jgi:hypothetical protein